VKKLAILDDYLHAALKLADWSAVKQHYSIDVFDRSLGVPDEAAKLLAPYEVLCTLRERMAFPRALIERLPNLKLLVQTGDNHPNFDISAATDHGVVVCNTRVGGAGGGYASVSEFTWGLLISVARHIVADDRAMRKGQWQTNIGFLLQGKTIGLIGLGRVGAFMARFAHAFGMNVIAWSSNLTQAQADACGARLVSKEALLRESDVVSLHLRLGERSRGIIGRDEFRLMKSSAILINTSRGPLVDEAALIEALTTRTIAGAGLDVYDQEPLSPDHPIRRLENVVITPHVGYLTEDLLRYFYEDTVDNILHYLKGDPVRVVNPDVLAKLGKGDR
jgi:phosphoglycerate dehydrogenase-like enzyme